MARLLKRSQLTAKTTAKAKAYEAAAVTGQAQEEILMCWRCGSFACYVAGTVRSRISLDSSVELRCSEMDVSHIMTVPRPI